MKYIINKLSICITGYSTFAVPWSIVLFGASVALWVLAKTLRFICAECSWLCVTFSSQFALTRLALLNFLAWYCRYLPCGAKLGSAHSWIQIYVLTCHIINFYANGLWCLTGRAHTWPGQEAPGTALYAHSAPSWSRASRWVQPKLYIPFGCYFIRLKNENAFATGPLLCSIPLSIMCSR